MEMLNRVSSLASRGFLLWLRRARARHGVQQLWRREARRWAAANVRAWRSRCHGGRGGGAAGGARAQGGGAW